MAQYLRGPENLAHAQFFHAMNGPHFRVGAVFDKHRVEGRNPGLLFVHGTRFGWLYGMRSVTWRRGLVTVGLLQEFSMESFQRMKGGVELHSIQHSIGILTRSYMIAAWLILAELDLALHGEARR